MTITWRDGIVLLTSIACSSCYSEGGSSSHLARRSSHCSEVELRGTVFAVGDRTRPYPGAVVAIIPEGSNSAANLTTSAANGRFQACLAEGKYAITVTTPDHDAVHLPPADFDRRTAMRDLRVSLTQKKTLVVGFLKGRWNGRPNAFARITRVSNSVGDIFYAPVGDDGSFGLRLDDGFEYVLEVVGDYVSLPLNFRPSQTKIVVEAFSTPKVEAAPSESTLAWIRQHIIPLKLADASAQQPEEPISSVVGDASVVGLGENGHGVGDFVDLRNQLFSLGVKHLGFTAIALEVNFSEALEIDDYIQTGKGDPAQLLTGLHFWTSDTSHTLELIEWMRRYNQDPAHGRKIHFYGLDMQFCQSAYRRLVRYLNAVDVMVKDRAKKSLAALSSDDDPPIARLSQQARAEVCASVKKEIANLDTKEKEYSARLGRRAWVLQRQSAVTLLQYCTLYLEQVNDSSLRDQAMADNLEWIVENEGTGARTLVWAHNSHISPKSDGWYKPLGAYLRSRFGNKYVAIGQFFSRGTFRAWDMRAPEKDRSVVPIQVRPAPKHYLEGVLSEIGGAPWFLDLRQIPPSGPIHEWFATPHWYRSYAATYLDEGSSKSLQVLPEHYDAVIFFDEVAAAKPNKSGLRGPLSR